MNKEFAVKKSYAKVKKVFYILKSDKYLPYVLLLPTLAIMIYFVFIPVFQVFLLSVQKYSLLYPKATGYVGLDNFRKILFQDTNFYDSLKVTFRWVLFEISLQLFFGMIIALLLNVTFKGRGIIRTVLFAPWAISGVLTTMMWGLMYNQHIGLFNDILLRLGLLETPIAWLANVNTVFYSVAIAQLWWGIPFFTITLLAGLQSIPHDIYESSQIDGCSSLKRFFYITLPFLKEVIIVTTLLRTVWEFNRIDVIYTMTRGGPVNLTQTLTIYLMKTTLIESDYGYGAALAAIVFVLLLAFSIAYLKISKYGSEIDD
jgi:multiple sugar transport system permease protein